MTADDEVDRRLRELTLRVVASAPPPPDLDELLAERRPAASTARRGPDRPLVLLAAVVLMVGALVVGAVARRERRDQPVATAGGVTVSLRAERDGRGQLATLLAGTEPRRIVVSRPPQAGTGAVCFTIDVGGPPSCSIQGAPGVSLLLVSDAGGAGGAGRSVVALVPDGTDLVSVTVDGAVAWQRPLDAVVAVPLGDVVQPGSLPAAPGVEVVAYDASGRELARGALLGQG